MLQCGAETLNPEPQTPKPWQTAIQSLVSPNAAAAQRPNPVTPPSPPPQQQQSVTSEAEGLGNGWEFPSGADADELGRVSTVVAAKRSLAQQVYDDQDWS